MRKFESPQRRVSGWDQLVIHCGLTVDYILLRFQCSSAGSGVTGKPATVP